MKKDLFDIKTTKKMALLSNLSLDKKEQRYLTKQFNETVRIIDFLNELETQDVEGTYHVTGLTNVFREDAVQKDRILTQKQALSNAKRVYKSFFVAKGIIDEK